MTSRTDDDLDHLEHLDHLLKYNRSCICRYDLQDLYKERADPTRLGQMTI